MVIFNKTKKIYNVMFQDYPDIVTITQLQKMLGISRHLAYNLVNDGYIHGIKIGNTIKIPKISVINYILENDAKK